MAVSVVLVMGWFYAAMRTDSVRIVREDGQVTDTPARLLRLLSLLQRRRHWSGPELAGELGVTTRTVRRDVERLRGLGYPVDAAPGAAGGYQLGNGGDLPPLLLDDDEATAIAVALSVTTDGAVRGMEQPALAALTKLDRLLPPRLRARVGALRASTTALGRRGDEVDAIALVELASACDGHERVTFSYTDRDGHRSDRRADPYGLVATGRRWYAVLFDVDRQQWRTLRVDRMTDVVRTGHRFVPDADAPDPAEFVGQGITTAPYRYQATARFPGTAPADLHHHVPPTVGVVSADPGDGAGSLLTWGADDLDAMAGHLVMLGLPFEVLDPPELRRHVLAVARRVARTHR